MDCDNICDKEQHLSCCYYQISDQPTVEQLTFAAGEEIRYVSPLCQMVFVAEGELEYTFFLQPCLRTEGGSFFTVPRKISINIRFLRPTTLIIYSFRLDIDFCPRLHENVFSIKASPYRQNVVLPANALLLKEMEVICTAIKKDFLCTKFLRDQLACIFTTMCAFYPSDLVKQFFAPLTNHSFREIADDLFRSSILQAQNKVFSVQELADLTNLNIVTFRRKFQRIFQMNPKKWIIENRKQMILDELRLNTKTLDEIAARLNFSKRTELHRFCQIHFGQTPQAIINGLCL
ncbi:MAG: AraC family transcriptional regulator [Dysgonamonadaceae bacterium]|jgi:AraC-like DNA-binding protein|nr:AraC family transcriptional regulator [Dysgonamonadaceae bacterium]